MLSSGTQWEQAHAAAGRRGNDGSRIRQSRWVEGWGSRWVEVVLELSGSRANGRPDVAGASVRGPEKFPTGGGDSNIALPTLPSGCVGRRALLTLGAQGVPLDQPDHRKCPVFGREAQRSFDRLSSLTRILADVVDDPLLDAHEILRRASNALSAPRSRSWRGRARRADGSPDGRRSGLPRCCRTSAGVEGASERGLEALTHAGDGLISEEGF